jgi:hypothetical protein
MNLRSSFPSGAAAALAVAALLWMGSTPAYPQSSITDSGLPPDQIESRIEANGYELAGPVIRHGAVYFANVLTPDEKPERLVIDARDGRILHHYPGNPAIRRQAANSDEWSPLTTFFDGLFGRKDDVAPLSPPPAADFLETPKAKPPVRRAKTEPAPAVQPANAPASANAAPTVAPSGANAASTAAPAPAPSAAASARSDNASAPPAAAPVAQPAKANAPKVNDVPVSPLE